MNWQLVTFLAIVPYCYPVRRVVYRPFSAKRFKAGGLALRCCSVSLARLFAHQNWHLWVGDGIRELDFTGFSGHTALSTFWPILLWLLCARATSVFRFASVIVGYALAGLVGTHDDPCPFKLRGDCRFFAGCCGKRVVPADAVAC
jgi:hypothetical protein